MQPLINEVVLQAYVADPWVRHHHSWSSDGISEVHRQVISCTMLQLHRVPPKLPRALTADSAALSEGVSPCSS